MKLAAHSSTFFTVLYCYTVSRCETAVVYIVAVHVVQLEMKCLKQYRIIEYKTLKGENNEHFFRESV